MKIGCGDEDKPERGLGIKMRPIYEDMIPCSECDHEDWNMPQCKECNAKNNFKYFERKENTK
jgi:hypothetical protein